MEERLLTPEEQRRLLALARSVIDRKLKQRPTAPEGEAGAALSQPAGAFVTLHKRSALRGCIGTFSADQPLIRNIEEMALAAAFNDPRFPPLTRKELAEVDLEISVLTPMRRIEHVDEIEVGRHGLYMVQGVCRGVLLPQVALENGWDRQTFLEHTCMKSGLGRNCWRDGATEIYVFSAQVFGEKELGPAD